MADKRQLTKDLKQTNLKKSELKRKIKELEELVYEQKKQKRKFKSYWDKYEDAKRKKNNTLSDFQNIKPYVRIVRGYIEHMDDKLNSSRNKEKFPGVYKEMETIISKNEKKIEQYKQELQTAEKDVLSLEKKIGEIK